MLETAIALLAAHMAADFVLQFNWIITNKRKPEAFALHTGIVLLTSVLALGAFSVDASDALWAIAVVTVSHAVIDAIKTYGLTGERWEKPRWDFAAFSLDQLAHLGVIMLAAFMFPNAFAQGEWSWRWGEHAQGLVSVYACFAGLIAATRMGQFTIGKFLDRFALPELETKTVAPGADAPDSGLQDGGAWIGLLERAVIFVLILIGQFAAIGFLLAAKSVLRFQYAHKRSQSEYVIIGTLTSFGWAATIGGLTVWTLGRLG
ncbi:MAG: DUF3307 domain-containing protein [Oceanicaulis sp.]|jgi:hypothetical protein|nr:DUF3307 domain-containing protein [Oceanicaulis sp.]